MYLIMHTASWRCPIAAVAATLVLSAVHVQGQSSPSSQSPSTAGTDTCPLAMLQGNVTATRVRALGAILARRARHAEALSCWQWVIRTLPNDEPSHFNSGMMYEKLRDYASAEGEFIVAHRLNPSNAHAVWHLGLVNLKLGRSETALVWFLQAADADSTDPYAWEGAARAAGQLGRDSLASAYRVREAVAIRASSHRATTGDTVANVIPQ
jgi:tetratricopeptide (TPR) repeat protein